MKTLLKPLQVSFVVVMGVTMIIGSGGGGGGGSPPPNNSSVQPSPTGKLNDTGITSCGDYAYGNPNAVNSNDDLNCSLFMDMDNDPIPPINRIDAIGQDGHVGRDVAANDSSNGHAGFDFTKISSTGQALEANANQWSCVKDNVTGLIWEVKTDDNGLHDWDWTYTWYEPDATKNGGNSGKQNGGACGNTSPCDTNAYVQKVNTEGWCGAKDWRLPTREEMVNLMDVSKTPIPEYFPNTQTRFTTSSTYAFNPQEVWVTGGGTIFVFQSDKDIARYVRLVRDGK
ncbi:DUF1566 domain-containing protein [Thiothrix subterranea]|uniref:Lcl C-terminal domain-containing protein n=1 Tax=Thiothrix subterranea TaxID=2735563 RepID=UPI00192B8430|nr:DUF1566 domain-containing protein [Thiothrix subterranea]QQZ28860.1 DUF1566 domain-containing protein [Thiothrix subterranea]